MNKNAIVFGGTGKTGQFICTELESKKIPYSVFTRKESTNKIKSPTARIKVGDVLNPNDVELAFENESYSDVIIALGTKDLKDSKIRFLGTKNILDVVSKNQSAAHIHVISALGVGDSWNQLKWPAKLISNLLIRSTMRDHNKQEELIINSSVTYHIVRPVGLKDTTTKGEVHVQNEGYLPSNSIQRIDVAKFLVNGVLNSKTGINGICQMA